MAIQITHPFVSMKGDGGDATLVRPSNWNAAHNTSMATGKLIGRLTAGAGEFEEITISSYMAGLLAAADRDALGALLGLFTTGDVKWSYTILPPSGWITVSTVGGTIGNAASAASIRANEDTKDLWKLIYANVVDAYAPVTGGRTGNAENDFNAGKKLALYLTGRVPVGAGNGAAGITTRAQGVLAGAETHTLIVSELASHYHSAAIYDPTHTHGTAGNILQTAGTFWYNARIDFGQQIFYGAVSVSGAATGVRVNSSNGLDTTYSQGGNGAHNNIQPSIALYAHVKL